MVELIVARDMTHAGSIQPLVFPKAAPRSSHCYSFPSYAAFMPPVRTCFSKATAHICYDRRAGMAYRPDKTDVSHEGFSQAPERSKLEENA